MPNFPASPQRINVAKLQGHVQSRPSAGFLGWLSFDERSISAITHLRSFGMGSVRFLTFGLDRQSVATNLESLRTIASDISDLDFVELDRSDQIGGLRRLRLELKKLKRKCQFAIIDISAFPREYVCLLALAIHMKKIGESTTLLYNIAADYSYFQKRISAKWLSRGIGTIQSVYGYSGKTFPGRPTALICLTGFDNDRLQGIVEVVDPQILVLDLPTNKDKKRDWISKRLHESLKETWWKFPGLTTFEFDCDYLEETKQQILQFSLKYFETYNVVLAPNNNKLSTFACAQAAMFDSNIQIIYAPALVYNYMGYAKPSSEYLISSAS